MTMAQTRRLWVAYGPAGAVGSILGEGDGYTVTMAGGDAPIGTYPELGIAKSALVSHLKPGSGRPEFHEH